MVMALEGDARGVAWVLGLMCAGCVHSATGRYGVKGHRVEGEEASWWTGAFTYRFGALGREWLLRGREGSGLEVGKALGVMVAPREEVVARAVGLARNWLRGSDAVLLEWQLRRGRALSVLSSMVPEVELGDEGSAEVDAGEVLLSTQAVKLRVTAEGVVWVRMEDRAARNMFSESLIAGMTEAFAWIERTPGCKVVVVSGYEGYFASGGTKESLLAIQSGQARFTDYRVFEVGLRCGLPVIAAMQGHGIGAGWTLGMFADVVLYSEESRYVSPYMEYGFTPGAGATWVLSEKLGRDVALESLLTGRALTGAMLRDRGVGEVWPRSEVELRAEALALELARGWRAEELRAWKLRISSWARARVEGVYADELSMHARTFVGQSGTLRRIEGRFAQAHEGTGREEGDAAAEVSGPGMVLRVRDGLDAASVQEVLRELLGQELQIPVAQLDADTQFVDLGLDSISGVTWVRKINARYGTGIEATKVYSHPTLAKFTPLIIEEAQRLGILFADKAQPSKLDIPRQAPDVPSIQTGTSLPSRRRRSATHSLGRRGATTPEPIAVIGMAGQFPQSATLDAFWRNIAEGRDCIDVVPAERWNPADYYLSGDPVPGKTNSRWFGAIQDYDRFDSAFFNISPREAESMDPQQRVFMQACWHGIEDAGYDARTLSGSRCGVFVGCTTSDYYHRSKTIELSAQGFTGGATSILAARISYFLNLQGPCISIDTACSSSLVAIAQACDSLVAGTSELALAGGVFVMTGPEMHIKTAQAGMLSPDGRCYTFDQRANGFVPGEGVGVVVLKRLHDAERDGDRICGVIRGWGVNQDGKTNGITAPNPDSQARLEREVYSRFGIDPAQIQLVEAHGTGTQLGDPIEVEALKQAFGAYTTNRGYCALGSVKSNIGHCLTAAGIAGALKVLLSLRHRQLPPSVHFERLNDHIVLEGSPFYVADCLHAWDVPEGVPRQGVVSSFGFSGTNAHVVISEYAMESSGWSVSEVLTESGRMAVPLSARTEEQLRRKVEDLLSYLQGPGASVPLREVAYTLQLGREAMEERLGIMAATTGELVDRLRAFVNGEERIEGIYQGQVKRSKESMRLISQDDEMKSAIVEHWLSHRRLGKILELWVKGLVVDWVRLYGDGKPRRVGLPGYPFARERYWIDREEGVLSGASVLHPMLHANVSDLGQQRYRTRFTGSEFFLSDHQVDIDGVARKVLPGVACLEMARTAVINAIVAKDSDMCIELCDTTWLRPIVVDEEITVEITLAAEDDSRISFEISSIQNDEPCVHCTGWAVVGDLSNSEKVDHARISERMRDGDICAEDLYAKCSRMGLNYGPSLRGVSVITRGDRELLTVLRIPDIVRHTSASYTLHPSILDSALQAVVALASDDEPSRRLPFAIGSMLVFSPCKTSMLAWVRYAEDSEQSDSVINIDIDLYDEQGVICAQIRKLSLRTYESRTEPAPEKYIAECLHAAPYWVRSDIGPSISTDANFDRYVFLCELPEMDPDEVACALANGKCESSPVCLDASIETRYESSALFCFERVRALLLQMKGRQTFVQIVAPNDGDASMLVGLAALLKTAALENPTLKGQMVLVPKLLKAESLVDLIDQDATQPFESKIRHLDDGTREIERWREIVPASGRAVSIYRDGGVYLITGGLGSLGIQFAQDILRRTDGSTVVLSGRSALDSAKQALLSSISGQSGVIVYEQADPASAEQMDRLIRSILERHGRLNGVLHSAGMIADNYLLRKEAAEFSAVLAPKVAGTVHLDRCTENVQLDFFVMFSSMAGAYGNPGQADYAVANAFMDAFAEHRSAKVRLGQRHGRTVSINWPLWREGGMHPSKDAVAMLEQTIGMRPMRTSVGLNALHHAIAHNESRLLVVDGDLARLRHALLGSASLPSTPAVSPVRSDARLTQTETQSNIEDERLLEATLEFLCGEFSQVLKLPASRIDPRAALEDYGIDSVLAMNLIHRLESIFGALSKTLLFEYQTVADLGAYLLKQHRYTLLERFGSSVRPAVIASDRMRVTPAQRPTPTMSLTSKGRFRAQRNQVRDIAIIGLAGRYPQADDIDQFWANLREGRDCITEIPPSRWNHENYYDADPNARGKSYSKWGGFIGDVDCFDPLFFNISPKEAELIDPQERIFLETAWHAIEDAGYSKESVTARRIGVYVGVMWGQYELYGVESLLRGGSAIPSSSHASIANRVSYYFDFRGPSLAVDTMCSSSLTAIHLACEELRKGDLEAAIAGGVNITVHPYKYLSLSQGKFVSSDGRCRSFGLGGDGYVPGEGVGAILLKPLDAARRDGDQIYGIVRASALNHGGKTNGYTVPNPNAQAELIAEALRKSNVDPGSLGYIETHGTGTSLGDPIEVTGLAKAFEQLGVSGPACPIGSVKSNIGHLEGAAGIAAVTKVLLQLRHCQLVPSIHADPPNPNIDFAHVPFRVQTSLDDWPRVNSQPRRAGISSFGAGGANAHVILEEEILQPTKLSKSDDTTLSGRQEPELFLLSARDAASLRRYAAAFIAYLREHPNTDLVDLTYTAQVGRTAMPARLTVLTKDIVDLTEKLSTWLASQISPNGIEAIDDVLTGDSRIEYRQGASLTEGRAGRAFVDDLLEHRDFTKLARLWVMGGNIDWSRLRRQERPRRISLPKYPFARERYWIPGSHPEGSTPSHAFRAPTTVSNPHVEEERKAVAYYVKRWMPDPLGPIASEHVDIGAIGPLLVVDRQEDFFCALQSKLSTVPILHAVPTENVADTGDEYSAEPYRIDPIDPVDAERLVESLCAREMSPGVIVLRARAITQIDAAEDLQIPDRDTAVLFHLSQAMLRRKLRNFRILLAFVRDDDNYSLMADAAMGFLNTLRLEQPECRVKSLEIASRATSSISELADLIFREIRPDAWNAEEVRYDFLESSADIIRTKSALTYCDPDVLPKAALSLPDHPVCLISGGLGGLGLLFAEHLIERYQSKLALVGRSLPSARQQEQIARLLAMGSEVMTIQADLSRIKEAERVISEVKARFGRIDGVLHCAGTQHDAMIVNKTIGEFESVASAKIRSALNLDRVTCEEPLAFFSLFSSIAGVTGNYGQCDYAYANRFLDAFAQARESRRKAGRCSGKTVSIDWPYWENGGMSLSREQIEWQEKHTGLSPLPVIDGMRAWEAALHADIAQIAVAYGAQSRIRRFLSKLPVSPSTGGEGAAAIRSNAVSNHAFLARTERYLKSIIGSELRLEPERIDANERLEAYGIDSVVAAHVTALLERDLGQLPKTLLYENETINELARHLVRNAHDALVSVTEHGQSDAVTDFSTVEHSSFDESTKETARKTQVECRRIAIIGVHGRYPHSETLDQYWANLRDGRDLIDQVPADRWRYEDFYDPDPAAAAHGKIYCKWGAFVADHDKFDAEFFNILGDEADIIDPQERLALESAWAAIEDAGYTRERLKRHYAKGRSADVGVFVGVTTNTYPLLTTEAGEAMRASAMPWSIANRISYFFDFCGPSIPIDTACSSSLVALHMACESIRNGDCQIALAGGVNLYLHPAKYQSMCLRRMLSADGACRSYGAGGDGFVPGEGVGMLVLKPLDRAIADNDHIHAVVAASAYDHSGRSNGYSAPSPNAQAQLIERTLRAAEIHPETIGYVEGHGTGTQIGDSLEIAAMTQAFRAFTDKAMFCPIGSVKANAGHAESAAGIAGITKILLQMRHHQLAPTIHAEIPNQDIDFAQTPFRLQTALTDWIAPVSGPRRALINSFGAGGVNACAILEEFAPIRSNNASKALEPQIFVLSAKTSERLAEYGRLMLSYLETSSEFDLAALCHTLQSGRECMEERLAIVAEDGTTLKSRLACWISGASAAGVHRGGVGKGNGGLARADISESACDLDTVAERWVAGVRVEWDGLRRAASPATVSLPAYPFARTRHWLTPGAMPPVASNLHPLITRNTSTLQETCYSSTLSATAYYARDHHVGNEPVMPGAAMIEMACVAGNIAGERRVRRILDIAWVRPLSFRRGDATVRTVLRHAGDNVECEIMSFDDDNDTVAHCECRLSYEPTVWSGDHGDLVAIPSLCERSARVERASDLYARFREHGLHYGPTFRTIEQVHVGDGYALSKLCLSEDSQSDAMQYLLHPCLIDGALQTVAALIHGVSPGAIHLPFLLQEIDIVHTLPRICYAYARFSDDNRSDQGGVRKFDISILSENGSVLVAMKKLYVRAFAEAGKGMAPEVSA
ncbi:MAG: SDR family NAD(P)-dependent oxidoreductase [Lysobacteraceae bacterium]|nr:MAG: SDR family NAD(P)-dependent oxidoreductase [Xanthomonadaceae bacterium]